MEINIDVLLFDISNNIIEETSLEKPETYEKLLETLRIKLKKLPNQFEIFIQSINGKDVIINDNQNYKLINDIIFIREINNDDLGKSIFQINYDKLSESNQNILDERFSCSICLEKIKNEKPLFCYKCQKIFHNNCLNDWDKKMKLQNKNLSCPNCRNELPLEKWIHKLDFEDNRKNEADKMNKFSQYDLILNINKAQEKKINELHIENEKQKKKLEDSFKFIKEILFKVEEIINIINPNNNNNINDYLKKLSIKNGNFPYKDFSQIANKKLEMIKNNIKYNFIQNNNMNEIKKFEEILNQFNFKNNIDNNINNIYEFKYEFNLVYDTKFTGIHNIFGDNFVINNKNKIDLVINGIKKPLIKKYILNKGTNNIKVILKYKLNNLEYMFCECNSLKDIGELKFLDTKEIKSFSNMFNGCSSLTDISALMNWNVSNSKNFSYMFNGCTSLTDIKSLQLWNVSNGTDFSFMFNDCTSLSDVKPLQYWNISNNKNYKAMFKGCTSLKDREPLKKWKLSSKDFKYLFSDDTSRLSNSLEKKNI